MEMEHVIYGVVILAVLWFLSRKSSNNSNYYENNDRDHYNNVN